MNTVQQDKYVKLYANCIATKGYSRSILCDLQFGKYQLIANELHEVLACKPPLKLSELYAKFDTVEHETIAEYLAVLEEKDFIFYTNEPELYPELELSWDRASAITNAVIDFDSMPAPNRIEQLVSQLNELGCEAVQLRLFGNFSKEEIETLLSYFDDSTLLAIELCLTAQISANTAFFERLIVNFGRISQIAIYGAETTSEQTYSEVRITYHTQTLSSECGNVHPDYFCISLNSVLEAHCYNSCLNRKLSIAANGDIRNCPYTTESFGNIANMDLKATINNTAFRRLWSITKDKVDVCKDCEFRYVCLDCRTYRKDPDNICSQSAKCTYNPYIAKWKHEQGYVPVEECGNYTQGEGFLANPERIAELNTLLWET